MVGHTPNSIITNLYIVQMFTTNDVVGGYPLTIRKPNFSSEENGKFSTVNITRCDICLQPYIS